MDPLEFSYPSQDAIPEAHRPLYTEQNGAFVLTGIKGIKAETDFIKINKALNNEREAHNSLRGQWKGFFGDRKPEEVQAILDRVPELEAAASGKLDDEKLNGIVETRVKGKLAPVERELNTTRTALQEAQAQINDYKSREVRRTIHDRVRDIAMKSKVVDTALEDVLMLAERYMEVDGDGNVSVKESGITPDQWLQEMQLKRPHWWPPSAGGGANAGGGGAFKDNPFTAANWNMTEQGRLVQTNRALAERMAAAAGTTIGGLKPAK